MKLEVKLPGRPVPWARARKRKGTGYFTPVKQAAHRESLATLIQIEMRALGIEQFTGPVALHVTFDYGKKETRLIVYPLEDDRFHCKLPDIDNLEKQILDALQDSKLVRNDSQIAIVRARKVK